MWAPETGIRVSRFGNLVPRLVVCGHGGTTSPLWKISEMADIAGVEMLGTHLEQFPEDCWQRGLGHLTGRTCRTSRATWAVTELGWRHVLHGDRASWDSLMTVHLPSPGWPSGLLWLYSVDTTRPHPAAAQWQPADAVAHRGCQGHHNVSHAGLGGPGQQRGPGLPGPWLNPCCLACAPCSPPSTRAWTSSIGPLGPHSCWLEPEAQACHARWPTGHLTHRYWLVMLSCTWDSGRWWPRRSHRPPGIQCPAWD